MVMFENNMNFRELNYKKIGLVVLFVLICFGLIFLIVRIFFTNDEVITKLEEGEIPGLAEGRLPTVEELDLLYQGGDPRTSLEIAQYEYVSPTAQGGRTLVLPVNATRVVSPTPTRGGQDIAFYDPFDGYFYRLSADGENKTLLTDEKFFTVSSVSWSPNKDRAVIEYPDGSNILYDFANRQKATLPKEVVDPEFSAQGDSLAFKLETDTPEDNWLIITDKDGNNAKFVEPIGDKGDKIDVVFSPDEQVVALFREPTGIGSSEVYPLGQSGENFKSISVDGLKFKGIYSPDGERLLYSVISTDDGYIPTLWVVDGRGANIGRNKYNLNVNTWIEKCTFSNNSSVAYCAVPSDLPEGAGFSNPNLLETTDFIYRIDLDTGIKKLLAKPVDASGEDVSLTASSIWIDKTEQTLFIWDAQTGGVYKIELK